MMHEGAKTKLSCAPTVIVTTLNEGNSRNSAGLQPLISVPCSNAATAVLVLTGFTPRSAVGVEP